jgi:hypothetical protein
MHPPRGWCTRRGESVRVASVSDSALAPRLTVARHAGALSTRLSLCGHIELLTSRTKTTVVVWNGILERGTRRHQRVRAVERPARARDVWRRGLHG